jgi:hypothetical protein
MISPFPDLSTTPTALKIRRLPHGGYLVSKVGSQAYTQDELFACADIDDALGFIKDQIGEPEKAEAKPANPIKILRACPHCGIPEGSIRDERCTGICGGAKPLGQYEGIV